MEYLIAFALVFVSGITLASLFHNKLRSDYLKARQKIEQLRLSIEDKSRQIDQETREYLIDLIKED